MGAALSKLWGAFKTAWIGGSSPGKGATHANGNSKGLENGLPTTNTPAKPPTPLPGMGIKKWKVTEPWIRLKCGLGEGPFWEDRTNTLRFLDVEKCELHSVDLNVGPSSHKVVKKMDISMGCTADMEGNESEFIFAGKYGYGTCNRTTGEYRWLRKVWSEEEIADNKPHRMRGNDGAVDSRGRFWAGFMNDPMVVKFEDFSDEGAVFRLDSDLTLHRPLTNILIPNGTTWNATDSVMYFTDSPSRRIDQFDFDPSTGSVSNRRPYFTIPVQYGEGAVPDGHCLDEEGYMWTAVHGGGVVLRISPEGELVGEISVPTQQPTCPAFCGSELVITSAGGTTGENGVDEFAGSVFKIDVGVKGLKRFRWKGGVDVEGGKVDGRFVEE